MALLDVIAITLYFLYYYNPVVLIAFIAMIIAGVFLMFLRDTRLGLVTAILVSLTFYYADLFALYMYIIVVASLVLLILDIVSYGSIIKKIDNFISGIYLYYRIAKNKKK